MTSSISVNWHDGINEQPVQYVTGGAERAIIGFASLQFFVLIYGQKLALFAPGFSLSVPMLVMFASVGWMVASGNLPIVAPRAAVFLIFFGLCLFSESLNQGSVTSFAQTSLLYSCMTVGVNLSAVAYGRIVNRFIMLMVLPAVIIIIQYTYQRSSGLSDPLNLERFIPTSLLMPGFYYNAHYPWNSTFSRPNGFFLLEPSFAAAFTATATILEISYFRRRWCVILMILATALSMGVTGISMLVIATPLLLARTKLQTAVLICGLGIAALAVIYLLGVPVPLLSRTQEFDDPKSSGFDRMLNPATEFMTALIEPSSSWVGRGAGSSPVGQVWPLLKLLWEFGPFAMLSFATLFIMGVANKANLPLKVALCIVYHFTGGYLLSPTLVELLLLFCVILVPVAEPAGLEILPSASRRPVPARPVAKRLTIRS